MAFQFVNNDGYIEKAKCKYQIIIWLQKTKPFGVFVGKSILYIFSFFGLGTEMPPGGSFGSAP